MSKPAKDFIRVVDLRRLTARELSTLPQPVSILDGDEVIGTLIPRRPSALPPQETGDEREKRLGRLREALERAEEAAASRTAEENERIEKILAELEE